MIKCLNKQKREQHEVHEMHNDGKPAETKYEVLDHEPEELTNQIPKITVTTQTQHIYSVLFHLLGNLLI